MKTGVDLHANAARIGFFVETLMQMLETEAYWQVRNWYLIIWWGEESA